MFLSVVKIQDVLFDGIIHDSRDYYVLSEVLLIALNRMLVEMVITIFEKNCSKVWFSKVLFHDVVPCNLYRVLPGRYHPVSNGNNRH